MTVEIQLTQGQVALVSDEDADYLMQTKWQAIWKPQYGGGGKFIAQRHAMRSDGRKTKELMHRIIMSRVLGRPLLRSEEVDHIHGNTLDNRRSELRLATHSQNHMNTGKSARNKSGYKGVRWDKGSQKWKALITCNGKQKRLGLFDNPADAYTAYCNAAKKLHGEFANLG